MKRKLLTSVGALLMLGMTTHLGMAASMTSNLNASITIIEGCTVNSKDINFGTWANLKSARTQTTTVMVSCNVNGKDSGGKYKENYTVSLSAGKSNNMTARTMVDTANNAIPYNIYVNPNYTGIFGDGTNGTAQLTGDVKVDTDTTFTVYAKTGVVAANPTPGTYTDILTLSVDY